jgi:hypothetical protein
MDCLGTYEGVLFFHFTNGKRRMKTIYFIRLHSDNAEGLLPIVALVANKKTFMLQDVYAFRLLDLLTTTYCAVHCGVNSEMGGSRDLR